MDEHVLPGGALNEAIALGSVKPLHDTLFLHAHLSCRGKAQRNCWPTLQQKRFLAQRMVARGRPGGGASTPGALCSSYGKISRRMQAENSTHSSFKAAGQAGKPRID